MYLLVIFLPLISSIFTGLFGRWVGSRFSSMFSLSCVGLSFLLSCIIFYEVVFKKSIVILDTFTWFETGIYHLHWGFLIDTLTCVMLIVVTSISTLVHLYSTEYMSLDPHLSRFMAYLSFFTFFMLILVTAKNLIQMFVGWEGVGLCSYLLINFWYGRIQANKAALKAMIVNRIGDFGLAIAIFTFYFFFSSLDYSILCSEASYFSEVSIFFFENSINLLDFIVFFLFVGAVGKSAQLGLHTWLPDAMEGPTPVSALIHAATMVTAGVFLICRLSPVLQYAPNVLSLITVVGGMTAFFAATTGLMQNDLKRVIAYSTCSQLGYMVFAAGLSSYSVSIFHLSNHAFFKALLFLGAGSVIHAMGDEQDMRKMGSLVKLLPLTYAAMFIGSLALMGFPFLTGFYSKDVILELAYGSFTVEGRFAHTLGTLAAFFTAYYSTRLIAMTFLRPANGNKVFYEHVHEAPFRMAFPLVVLSIASIFIGYVSRDMMIGLGTDFWGNALFTLPTKQYMLESEWLDSFIKMIPLFFSFGGTFLGIYNYLFSFNLLYSLKTFKFGRSLYTFLNRKWYFDKVYNEFVSQSLLKMSYFQMYQNMDRGLLEYFGPNGIAVKWNLISREIREKPMGFIYKYLFLMISVFSVVLFVFLFWNVLIAYFDISFVLIFLYIVFFNF